ncbi:MAG: UDP-N-acetylmuramoyl-L-alanyl-D-glutamate--2,6-diaminopimelate ligase [Rhizobiales bacterium]|nr:UDP-N-acetylmuramoyl-L-alanyl-D-glutamate--2,6-diaminopimelate ligase [Hyphomicrobiales bacterium]
MRLDALITDDAEVAPSVAGVEIGGITCDSRDVKPGYLFAALPGVNVDGAKFIPSALEKGAVAILSREAGPDDRFVQANNPRQVLAHAAARFYSHQPETIVAVTGTNGKTSVVSFVRQIWQSQGIRAASLGTVGVEIPGDLAAVEEIERTTPDPVQLQKVLDELGQLKITHAALEASSHGLAQFRLDGVRLAAGAFTNISRDHLDYHESFEDYFAQKMRLFSELLGPGGAAVVDADTPQAAEVLKVAKARGLSCFTVGRAGQDLKLVSAKRRGFGQHLKVRSQGEIHELYLPLVGDFQVSNALVAAGLVLAVNNGGAASVLRSLENLTGAVGRLDMVGQTDAGVPVYVDYAHTPEALSTVLKSLKPYASNRLSVVFGAGGDRDPGKRVQMGQAACEGADLVYVTDDNPRTEDPAAIRASVLEGCPGAIEVAGRREAINRALADAQEGDVLLIAGKGHEDYQEVGTEKLHFSDHEEVLSALGAREHG